MDQNDFLRLMTTQLTTQDPFNPVDNTQMVAQMAQFSQVAGIAEMNQSLQTHRRSAWAAAGSPTRRAGSAARCWSSPTSRRRCATAPMPASSTLPKRADQVTVSFVDANGAVVHTRTLGAQRGRRRRLRLGRHATTPAKPSPAARCARRHRRAATASRRRRPPPPGPRSAASSRPPTAATAASSPASACSSPTPPSASPDPRSPRSTPMSFYTSLSGLRGAQTDLVDHLEQHRQRRLDRLQAQPRPVRRHHAGLGDDRRPGHAPQGHRAAVHARAASRPRRASSTSPSPARGFFVTRDALTGGTTYFTRNGSLSIDGRALPGRFERRLCPGPAGRRRGQCRPRPASPPRATSSCR